MTGTSLADGPSMARYQSPLAVVVKGALAGVAGTVALTAFMERAPQLMEQLGIPADQPPAPPADPEAPASPAEELAERVTEGEIDIDTRMVAGDTIHVAYGAAWGAYFAIIQSTFRPPSILHGLFLGGLMTVVATRFVPSLGLAPEPRTRSELATSAAAHAVYGVVTAVAYRILNLGRAG